MRCMIVLILQERGFYSLFKSLCLLSMSKKIVTLSHIN